MPALLRHEQERRIVLRAGIGDGFLQDDFLDRLALLIVQVEELGIFLRLLGLARGEQIDAEAAAPDASAGIDPRSEDVAAMIGRERRERAGDLRQRGEARALQLHQLREAGTHEGAVDADERNHVADRRQRDEIERLAQIGLGNAVGFIPAAQRTVERDGEQERHARGAEMALARAVARLIGIDLRKGRRRALHRVMVEHDDIEARVARRLQRRVRRGAAIDGDDEAGTLVFQLQQRARRRAIAFAHPVGDVDARFDPERGQEIVQQRRRARSVDVVIAEDRDALAVLDRVAHARDRLVHVLEIRRLGQQALQRRVERVPHLARPHAPRRQQLREHERELGRAHQLAHRVLVALTQHPPPSGERAGDEGGGWNLLQSCGQCHLKPNCHSRPSVASATRGEGNPGAWKILGFADEARNFGWGANPSTWVPFPRIARDASDPRRG